MRNHSYSLRVYYNMLFILYSVEIPNRTSGGKGDKTSNEYYFIQIWNGWYKRPDNNGINSSKADEKRSYWAIVSIDEFEIDAKIIHRGRGEFEILEDNYRGKYIGKLVDASDVIRCKVEDDKPLKPELMVRDHPRCDSVNTLDNKHCSKCSYELTREQIKTNEDLKLKAMEEKHKQDIEVTSRNESAF
jgi:hypothetical protein